MAGGCQVWRIPCGLANELRKQYHRAVPGCTAERSKDELNDEPILCTGWMRHAGRCQLDDVQRWSPSKIVHSLQPSLTPAVPGRGHVYLRSSAKYPYTALVAPSQAATLLGQQGVIRQRSPVCERCILPQGIMSCRGVKAQLVCHTSRS